MRIISVIMMAVLMVSSSIFAQRTKFVQPKNSGVGVYKNETRGLNETPIVKVGTNDRLTVLKDKRDHYQVRTEDNVVGWVEKRLVAAASGRSFQFDNAEVIGYLDSPTPVYIIDADAKDQTPIRLDRSFAEALRQNVDRETVERLNN